MNKIVREHYPVDKLPEDLRRLVSGDSVTIVLTEEAYEHPPALTRSEAVALMRQMQEEAAAAGTSISTKDAVSRIRALRDEWDD